MYKNLRTIKNIDIKNKTVVLRANLDVPLDDDDQVEDNTKILSVAKTVEYLLENNCKIVIISHLGRPNGKHDDKLSLLNIRFELAKVIGKPVKFAHITACENSIKFMEHGEVLLLENLRFNAFEESTDEKERMELMKPLAELCDLYITDDFGTYSLNASTVTLPKMIPSYAGFHIIKEVESVNKLLETEHKPFTVVIGGSKVDTKVPLIKSLVGNVDTILIGGKIAYTFLKAKGHNVGKADIRVEDIRLAEEILKQAENSKTQIILPIDHVCAEEFDEDSKPINIESVDIPDDLYGLDIGLKTLEVFKTKIEEAKTILWNGPMGIFEWNKFKNGTQSIGEYITIYANKDSFRLAGGGDTTLAINKLRLKQKRFSHISIGGGMLIKYIAGESFEALDVLVEKS